MFFVRRTSGSSFKNKDEARLCTILGQKEEIIRFANDLVVRVNCSNYLSTRQWKVTYCHEWSFQRIVQLRTSEFFFSRFFSFSLDEGDPIMKFPWTMSRLGIRRSLEDWKSFLIPLIFNSQRASRLWSR